MSAGGKAYPRGPATATRAPDGSLPARGIPRYIEWYQQGELPVDKLLSERIRLSDLNAGFDRLAAGQTIRQVVIFD